MGRFAVVSLIQGPDLAMGTEPCGQRLPIVQHTKQSMQDNEVWPSLAIFFIIEDQWFSLLWGGWGQVFLHDA